MTLWGFALFFWLGGVVLWMLCDVSAVSRNALAIGGVTTALGAVWSMFLQMSLRKRELALKQREIELQEARFEFDKTRPSP